MWFAIKMFPAIDWCKYCLISYEWLPRYHSFLVKKLKDNKVLLRIIYPPFAASLMHIASLHGLLRDRYWLITRSLNWTASLVINGCCIPGDISVTTTLMVGVQVNPCKGMCHQKIVDWLICVQRKYDVFIFFCKKIRIPSIYVNLKQ